MRPRTALGLQSKLWTLQTSSHLLTLLLLQTNEACTESRQRCEACLDGTVKLLSHANKDFRHKKVNFQHKDTMWAVTRSCGSCFIFINERVSTVTVHLFACMELINSWVILEILEFMAYAGEIIFQIISGPTFLQTFRATHAAAAHRWPGCVTPINPRL